MPPDLARQIAALAHLPNGELRAQFAALFGPTTYRATNRTWLIRRIAWRLQALAEGDLSERARRRAADIAHDADLRLTAPRLPRPKAIAAAPPPGRDHRLPCPGTVLQRRYQGATIQVLVHADAFEYAGQRFPSLSAVAKAVTGSH